MSAPIGWKGARSMGSSPPSMPSGMPSPRVKRRTVVLACNILAVAGLFGCCNPGTSHHQPTPMAHIAVCAVDPAYSHNASNSTNPAQSYCGPGDFQALHQTQLVRATAFDKNGAQMPSAKITFHVSGANAASGTQTASAGIAEFS